MKLSMNWPYPILSVLCSNFHVFMLRRYTPDESHVISYDSVELGSNLTYEEKPMAILDRRIRQFRIKEIASVKVQWRHQRIEEATWKIESDMYRRYPRLLEVLGTFPFLMFDDEHDF